MQANHIGGEDPPLLFPEIFTASREQILAIYGLEQQNVYFARLLSLFDEMGKQNLEIDQLPAVIAGSKPKEVGALAPVIAAWRLLRFAAKLFDDAEDERHNSAELINLGTGFLFTAQQVLSQWERNPFTSLFAPEIHHRYNLAALKACSGQHEDLFTQTRTEWIDPETWLEIALAKSGELFAWATWAGAYFANLPPEMVTRAHEFGYHLGGLIQVADDFREVWGPDQTAPISSARSSLPIIYAHFVGNPSQQQYLEEVAQNTLEGTTDTRNMLNQFLIQMGAQKYMLAAGWMQKQKALEALSHMEVQPGSLKALHHLLDRVFPSLPEA